MHGYYDLLRPKTLSEVLEFVNSEDILGRIRLLPGNSACPSRKAERIEVLVAGLQGEALRSLWSRLKEKEKVVIATLVHSPDGCLNEQQIVARYGSEVLDAVCETDYYGHRILKGRILLFLYPEERHRASRTIPEDLKKRLREFVPPLPKESVATAEGLPESVVRQTFSRGEKRDIETPLMRRDMEIAAQHDLIVALRFVSQGKVTVSAKTAQATAATVRNLGALLHGGDFFELKEKGNKWEQVAGPVRAYAWPWMLRAAKLVRRRGNKLELSKVGQAALSAPPYETLKTVWNAWVDGGLLDEFNRVDTVKGQRGKGKRGMTLPHGRRVQIVGAMSECPGGEWVKFDEFSRFMRADDRHFDVTANPWRLYFASPEHGSLGYADYHGWHLLQDRYMLCFLLEYAASLGLIDVAYTEPHSARPDYFKNWGTDELSFISRYDGLEYFRVNTLGAYCLGATETYRPSTPADQGTLTVLPNRNIQVSGVLSVDEKLLLEAYAIEESENLWRLNGDRILTALETGHDMRVFREFLDLRDEQELPERVEGFLRDIERCAHALEPKGTALLFECADAEIAERIASSRQAGKLCKRTGKSGLVVRVANEDKFKKAVRTLGYGMPVV